MLMPTWLVYATCGANHRSLHVERRRDVEDVREPPFAAAFLRCGMHACEHANVPRVLIWCIRSNRFIGVCSVP